MQVSSSLPATPPLPPKLTDSCDFIPKVSYAAAIAAFLFVTLVSPSRSAGE